MGIVKILKFMINFPKRNEWKLSESCKWLYKDIEITRFSKKGVLRINIIFYIKYNFDWKKTQEIVNQNTRLIDIDSKQLSYRKYNLGLVNFSFKRFEKK